MKKLKTLETKTEKIQQMLEKQNLDNQKRKEYLVMLDKYLKIIDKYLKKHIIKYSKYCGNYVKIFNSSTKGILKKIRKVYTKVTDYIVDTTHKEIFEIASLKKKIEAIKVKYE